ncbi:DciA family protein [Candidatus Hydrogenosomobacter endosymbioticus]|uniref:Uncharacterized protein n=1 Tax=Candidatus Hydrogenosomobacter endosymbioticus TaxID=2558174 RepID=A0ABN6L2M7_9PROT|nr:DciA family protein [Candidatus Hydrogenosomobacter endosymbioticus]BDB96048.1 hypothetical protein HYD_1810 [Candidatus Hydrogenosomobacter endosymbioticus]
MNHFCQRSKGEEAQVRGFSGKLGELTGSLISPVFKKKDNAYVRLAFDWPFVVGKDIASYTYPHRIKSDGLDSVFHILVLQERILDALHQTHQILERTNGYFGYMAVNKVVCKKTSIICAYNGLDNRSCYNKKSVFSIDKQKGGYSDMPRDVQKRFLHSSKDSFLDDKLRSFAEIVCRAT